MSKKKVMFVDDESDQLFSFEQALENCEEDIEFIGVESGKECLQMLENDELPDIIFLDIMMNPMSGWEVYDKIKNNPVCKDIPIVILTARTVRINDTADDFSFDDYLEKPAEIKDIIECINKVLNRK